MYFCFSHTHLRFALTWTSSISRRRSSTVHTVHTVHTVQYSTYSTVHTIQYIQYSTVQYSTKTLQEIEGEGARRDRSLKIGIFCT